MATKNTPVSEASPGLTEAVLVLASPWGLPVGVCVDALACMPSRERVCVCAHLCVPLVSKALAGTSGLSTPSVCLARQ